MIRAMLPRPALRVFVSSTSVDLRTHRELLVRGITLLRLGAERMEAFGADPGSPFDVCMKHVDDSDALVVVVAHRYGWCPSRKQGGDDATSITWHEVNRALDASKPVFAFLVDETAPWDDALRDTEPTAIAALRRFKAYLSDKVTRETFRESGDLAVSATASIANWLLKSLAPAPLSAWTGRPASIGASFVGRNRELSELADLLRGYRRAVVVGGAGSGKSRVAAEYAARSGAPGLWSTAGSTAEMTLAALASQLHIAGDAHTDEEQAAAVEAALRTSPAGTLWVVDNVPSLDQCIQLANHSGSVMLLATSRDERRHLLAGWGLLPLRPLDPEPANELLRSRGYQGGEDLRDLAEAVGRLPLALEALAVQLGSASGPRPAARSLARLKDPQAVRQFAAFNRVAGFTVERPEGVLAALTGCLNRLPEDVRGRISPLGYLADAPVPIELLSALTGLDEDSLDALIDVCRQESVLSADAVGARVHALTLAAIAATNDSWAVDLALVRAENRLNSTNRDDPVAMRSELEHHASLRAWFFRSWRADDPRTLEFSSNLALGYRECGRNNEAIGIWEETLATQQRVLGPEHTDTLTTSNHLAGSYRAAGRNDQAIKLWEETLAIRERTLGAAHPDTLRSKNDLAGGYREAGRNDEAIKLWEETLAVRVRNLGSEHPDTLGSMNDLAGGYREAGRNDEAIKLWEQALAVREKVLGAEHPRTLTSRNNLAVGLWAVGRNDEAIRLDEGTLAVRERVLGGEHPHTLTSRNNLAVGYQEAGRNDEAIKIWEETLAVRERVLGPEHQSTLITRNYLAVGLRAVGRSDEAIRLDEQTLAVRKRDLGPKPDKPNKREQPR